MSTRFSDEQEHAVLHWLSSSNVAFPDIPGLDANLLSAITTKLLMEEAINIQVLRLAEKEWLLDPTSLSR